MVTNKEMSGVQMQVAMSEGISIQIQSSGWGQGERHRFRHMDVAETMRVATAMQEEDAEGS